jgi:hypothetical protein
MPLLPWRKRSAPEPAEVLEDEPVAKPGGKNRPTPKRSEARAARGQVTRTPVSTRKDSRATTREDRRTQAAEQRQAMMSGDVAKMPAYHRAPERVYARELVDQRRSVAPLFLPVAVLCLFLSQVRVPAIQLAGAVALYVMMVGLIVDAFLLARYVHKRVAEKFPNSGVPVRMYSFQRSIMPKRWRMPRPAGYRR